MCRPMRSEILPRIQELLAQEDLEGIRVQVREAIEQFRALTAEEVRKQREAWAAASNDRTRFSNTSQPGRRSV